MSMEKSIVATEALSNGVDEILPVMTLEASKAIKKNPPTHPRYIEMVTDAIVTLKERNGSSHYAIAKHIQEKHKRLPSNFKKLLLVQLKKLVATEKLVKVKNSFKLPLARGGLKESKSAAAPTKKSVKPVEKIKGSTVNANLTAKLTAKPKTKLDSKFSPAKAKPDSKTKPVAKPKTVEVKPKVKATGKPAKAAKTSTRTSPRKGPGPKPTPKKNRGDQNRASKDG